MKNFIFTALSILVIAILFAIPSKTASAEEVECQVESCTLAGQPGLCWMKWRCQQGEENFYTIQETVQCEFFTQYCPQW